MRKHYAFVAATVAGLWCAPAMAQTTSDPSAGTGSAPTSGSTTSGSMTSPSGDSGSSATGASGSASGAGSSASSGSSGPMRRMFGGMGQGDNPPNLNSSFSGGSGSQVTPRTTGGASVDYRPGTGSVMTEPGTGMGASASRR
jgi:hypothetical protein